MTDILPNDIDMALSFVESEVEALRELGFDDYDAANAINEFRRIEVLLMKLRRLTADTPDLADRAVRAGRPYVEAQPSDLSLP
ncbi:two component response regulator [Roseibium sp. TrichSKD4]|uniref:hypothetical protein n=1 Tax=Roseibium sp. TrichSKD4 TaxID=744980 RepID=UPI0001E5692E|nr:hypothetical protein [Roseibium sp. TrichSKD4]EFO32462.1 two component response regulator [Roseibium sp. TrichSKD4]